MRIPKMMRFITGAVLLATGLLAAPVFAQEIAQPDKGQPLLAAPAAPADENAPRKPRKPRLTLKPTVGLFWPTNGKTKSVFGSSWTMLGLTVDYRDEDRSRSRFQFEIDGIARKSYADRAAIFAVGAKYTERFNTSRRFSPYVGVTAGWCFGGVKSVADGVNTGFRSAGIGGSAFVGTNVGMNVKLEGAYHVFPSLGGFNLSGLSVGVQLQF